MPAEGEITAERLFGEDRPLHFEIGFGSGEHLADRADMLPDHGFIGAEPFLNGVATALGHIRDKHLANVRLWRGDALDVLQRVPDGALSFLYLLHPDPWPKARHAKRRMVNDRPVDLFAAKLKPGGEFRLATDDPTYLTWSLMVMQRHAHAVRMARRDARATSSSRPAAGSRPATAPSRAARAAGLIICATAASDPETRAWISTAGPCSAPLPCPSPPGRDRRAPQRPTTGNGLRANMT